MATFIPGVGDITPQVEYFQPNLELMTGYLETKQGQFNAARDELNSVYTTLKSLDLTLDENKERREEFFNSADQELKKLSSVDLSLPQNVAAAKRIFNPLVEDQAMNEDLLFTSKIQNVVSTAEKFRNSSNAEDRKRYNPLTSQYAALKQQEYINASPDARANVANSNIRYASNVNLMEKATALAKEMDLNVSVDVVTGGYQVTNKNGALVTPHLQSAFSNAFMSDPEVSDYYRQKAYVDVQSQVLSLAPQIGYDAAVQAVTEDLQLRSQLTFASSLEEAAFSKNKLLSKRNELENLIQTEGVVEGSEEHREYLNVLKNLELATQAEEEVGNNLSLSQTQMTSLNDAYDLSFLLDLTSGINDAAETLSMRNAEQSIKADAFALEAQKQRNRLSLAQYNAELDMLVAQAAGSSVDEYGNVVVDPIGGYINAEANARGAVLTEPAEEVDLNQVEKSLSFYKNQQFELYKEMLIEYSNPKNGTKLSSMGNLSVDAYLKMQNDLSPVDKQKQIAQDLNEILESKNYDYFKMESYGSITDSYEAAVSDYEASKSNSLNNLVSSYGEEQQDLLTILLNNGDVLSKEEFITQASNIINQIPASEGAFRDYRSAVAAGRGAVYGRGSASRSLLSNAYEGFILAADKQFKNTGFNVHQYFDPDIVGQGTAMTAEVNKSYSLDPLLYYDNKRPGHQNSMQGYQVIQGINDARNASTEAYAYSGSMLENTYIMADDFDLKDENQFSADNIATKVLDKFVEDSRTNQKSSAIGRPNATLDVAKDVYVGGQRYVSAQVTFDQEYINKLKELGGDFSDIESNKFTMYVPQRNITTGIFATDGTGALLSNIKKRGSVETRFPNNMGNVTYTYVPETGQIEVYGVLQHFDPEKGNVEYRQYVDQTDEESFEYIRRSVQSLYNSTLTQNKEDKLQFEADNNIVRESDPNKLK